MTALPVRMWIFWSTNRDFLSLLIRLSTRGPWSHMGIGFDLDDGRSVYFEALFGEGFLGPKPAAKLRDFEQSGKRGRVVLVEVRGMTEGAMASIFAEACRMVGTTGYNQFQLLSMWCFEKFGKYVGLVVRPSRRTVCSEAVARLLFPNVDLRDSQRTTFDSVSPNSAWRRWQVITGEAT